MRTPAPRKSDPEANRRKVRDWRARKRAQGLRPVQVWVPDMRDPAFLSDCRRQAIAANHSSTAAEDQAWVDEVSIDLSELP